MVASDGGPLRGGDFLRFLFPASYLANQLSQSLHVAQRLATGRKYYGELEAFNNPGNTSPALEHFRLKKFNSGSYAVSLRSLGAQMGGASKLARD
jgi:hypothetical protein